MLSNGDTKSVEVVLDINEDEVEGENYSDLALGEKFEILDTEDDFEKKTITKIFNICRNGETSKLKNIESGSEKSMKRIKKWLEKSHDDKAKYMMIWLDNYFFLRSIILRSTVQL